VLLQGAEKLCAVYALPGALERIPALRRAYAQQSDTLAYYERKVAEQQEQLERMNAERGVGLEEEEEEQEEEEEVGMTAEDLKREEEEVRQLEKKKRELQARLRALESDLGGLLNV
jgi:chromosome segregation ATPase